jgi:hypothetical protein
LPFFKKRLHLSAFLGSYHPSISHFDLVAHEYDLFGDFTCDLALGDSRRLAYVFVELEDAAPGSVFVHKRGKNSPEWAPRFERGFSQMVDWFYKLADMEKTDEFAGRFGARTVEYSGLLVVGKDDSFGEKEARRLRWRQEKVIIDSCKLFCVTYDRLFFHLEQRLRAYERTS